MKIGKSEIEKRADDMLKCRQIAKEIFNFGVTQQQIMQLIHLLALELENNAAMIDIVAAVKAHNESLIDENVNLNKTKLLD